MKRTILSFIFISGFLSAVSLCSGSQFFEEPAEKRFNGRGPEVAGLYRDWGNLSGFARLLKPIAQKAAREKRPLKIAVYGVSKGELIVTYAVEMMTAGIKDFVILGFDQKEENINAAGRFEFDNDSVRVLTLGMQERFKKYFDYNTLTNKWEPKNRQLFETKVKFLKISPFKDFRPETDSVFKPGYDVVSLVDVLSDATRRELNGRKEYWASALNNGAMLILHDPKHSAAGGALGYDWAFKNFLFINDWISIKTESSSTSAQKIAEYEERYDGSKGQLKLLVDAYLNLQYYDKAAKKCRDYIKDSGFSSYARVLLADCYLKAGKKEKAVSALKEAPGDFVYDSIDRHFALETDRSETEYLKLLGKKYEAFIDSYGKKPAEMETIFDYRNPATKKYDRLRKAVRSYTLTLLLELHVNQNSKDDADRLSIKGLNSADKMAAEYPGCANVPFIYSRLMMKYIPYCLENDMIGKVMSFCDKGIRMFETEYKDSKLPYVGYCLGGFNLYKASALVKNGSQPVNYLAVKSYCDSAIVNYEKIMHYRDELEPLDEMDYHALLGRAYFIRGKMLLEGFKDNAGATQDLLNARKYLEWSIGINPSLAFAVSRTRDELMEYSKKNLIVLNQ